MSSICTSRRAIVVLSVALSFGSASAQQDHSKRDTAKPTQTLSVCDILRNLRALEGRMVTVRGVFGWDARHGYGGALTEYGLDPYVARCPGMPRSQRSWPPVIKLESVDYHDPADAPANFREESPRYRDLVATLAAYGRKTGTDAVVATLVGEIRTRTKLVIRRSGEDIIGNGYGQAGACPALLIVKTVIHAEDPQNHTPLSIQTNQNP